MGMYLTEKVVAQLKPPKVGYTLTNDGGHPKAVSGFGVRTTAAGVKSFVLTYRFRGASRRFTIGRLGAHTVASARERAGELRRMIDEGRDPLEERIADREAPLMSELFDRYLEEHAAVHKKPRSYDEDWGLIHGGSRGADGKASKPYHGTLGHHFAKMQVVAVSREHVMKFHGGLKATPYRANRAIALLSKAMNLAEVWGLRPENSNPCRHVQKFKEEKRSRFLDGDELGRLGTALSSANLDTAVVAAIRFLVFTGCRVSEALGLRWADVDMKRGTARLVDAKAGARDVQLPAPALAGLSELSRKTDLLFNGLTYSSLDRAWRRIRDDAGLEGVRLHDLRHTTGTYAGAAGFNAFDIRDLLGHKTLSMTGRYVEKYADRLKHASGVVAGQIAAAMANEKAEVVPLPTGRRSK